MATPDTNPSGRPKRSDLLGAYVPAQRSSASTWYLVIGAAVLLMVLYVLTTGLMRSAPPQAVNLPHAGDDIRVAPTMRGGQGIISTIPPQPPAN